MISITKWFWDKWQSMLLTQYMLLVFQTYCSISNTCKLQKQHLVAFATFLCCICNKILRMRHQCVAYTTQCCVCNKMLRMRHLHIAYATKCCICNKFSQEGIFLKIGSWKYFLMFRSWFMCMWTIPNWKETWSNMKIVLVVPRIHSGVGRAVFEVTWSFRQEQWG